MTQEIFYENESSVVFTSDNYLYIDNIKNVSKRLNGVYTTKYVVEEKDSAGKKFPFLKNRDKLTGERYLHSVHIVNKDSIGALCKNFDIEVPKLNTTDERKIIFKDDENEILEYSTVSYALFTNDKDISAKLNENGYKYNTGLMSSGFFKKPGFVLPKRKADKENLIEYIVRELERKSTEFEGNNIQYENKVNGNDVYSVWGSLEYVIEEISNIGGNNYIVLDSKRLVNGRIYIKLRTNETE